MGLTCRHRQLRRTDWDLLDMTNVRIISGTDERFRDREEAGRLLSYELQEFQGADVIVLGVPRGGVIVAREIARELKVDLDIVLAHKMRTPGHPELAMGAVTETGRTIINEALIAELGIARADIEAEKTRQLVEIRKRSDTFRQVLPKVPPEGKVVIVTDDGVATGATTEAALWAVREECPKTLVGAIPVGPGDTIRRLAGIVDGMICLRSPQFFLAVGQFYQQFRPVDDADLLEILKEEGARRRARQR